MIGPNQVLLFVVLSAVAVVASLHAWRTRLAYGFFRFFGFEVLALHIVWNAGRWFRDPLSIRQIVSWIIIAASTALAVHGVYLLRSVGKARHRVMEDTETVVEVGVYRFIRHPLYASLLFFGWGVFLKGPDLPSAALALAATAFWVATARYEERFNIDRFGVAYSEYMKRTKMFVPFLL
jgi:protein-S-isoprenylcysteine O-methyltransferase Ste14